MVRCEVDSREAFTIDEYLAWQHSMDCWFDELTELANTELLEVYHVLYVQTK
jgi:hypothetical protein